MISPYDNFDYPSYWKKRKYEHLSESLVIKRLLEKIPKLNTILEVGAGYGRLIDLYEKKGKSIVICDPSSKLLKIAKNNNRSKKFIFKRSKLEDLNNLIDEHSVDLVIMVRVMHHIKNCEIALKNINDLLKDGGFLLIEFPNKRHVKNTIKNLFRGNFKYYFDQIPIDISKKNQKKILPFRNFHPDMILDLLNENGFTVLEKISASNLRHKMFKRIFNLKHLLLIEKKFQKLFSIFNFGPSIFILAQKSKD